MDQDGGTSRFATNKAGAQYGTGYCDSQCAKNVKFINGEANIMDYTPAGPYGGLGRYGSCCSELDIWEGKHYFNHAKQRERALILAYSQ
jgi:cellulose 1,4-beta-cellobiosidase